MKKRPASYSLHLDYIIRNSTSRRGKQKQERHARSKGLKSKINQVKVSIYIISLIGAKFIDCF